MPTKPNIDEMFTMWPSSSASSAGRNSFEPYTTPQKLIPMSQAKSSSD